MRGHQIRYGAAGSSNAIQRSGHVVKREERAVTAQPSNCIEIESLGRGTRAAKHVIQRVTMYGYAARLGLKHDRIVVTACGRCDYDRHLKRRGAANDSGQKRSLAERHQHLAWQPR